MGNVPTREERRNRASSVGSRNSSSRVSLNHNATFPGLSMKKRLGKEQSRQSHASDLVVRYEENVDGGYLAPYGTYAQNLDYDTSIVRSLIVQRKIAPFYTPLQDIDTGSDDTVYETLRKSPLHGPFVEGSDEEEFDDHKIHRQMSSNKRRESFLLKKKLRENARKWQNQACEKFEKDKAMQNVKTFPHLPSRDLILELYSEPVECPICFLYYPPFLNTSRCCLQPICTECFVQIKRLEPHFPHDDSDEEGKQQDPESLISECAKCPFCAMSEFGVTYHPPDNIRTGMNSHLSAAEFQTETKSAPHTFNKEFTDLEVLENEYKPRRASLPSTARGVITTDMIRPDWEAKLQGARSRMARKSAAASAIHAASLITEEDSRSRNSMLRFGAANFEERMIEEAMRLSLMEQKK